MPSPFALYRAAGPIRPIRIPLFGCSVPAGFPSPADDHLDEVISLDETLISHPAATFLAVVRGDSMRDANLDDGDVLVVDRSLTAESGDIVCDGNHKVAGLWKHKDAKPVPDGCPC